MSLLEGRVWIALALEGEVEVEVWRRVNVRVVGEKA